MKIKGLLTGAKNGKKAEIGNETPETPVSVLYWNTIANVSRELAGV
jgi:hypothetical protein